MSTRMHEVMRAGKVLCEAPGRKQIAVSARTVSPQSATAADTPEGGGSRCAAVGRLAAADARMPPTAAMRRHLEMEGSATAEVLAGVASIPSGRVSALLKDDLKFGRVEFLEGYDGEKRVYRWNDPPVLTPTLRKAIEQLEELGYVVIAP